MKILLASIVSVVGLSACGSDGVSEPRAKLTDIFVLRSVDGAPLPAKANRTNAAEFTLVADTIRIYDDGSGTQVSVRSRPDTSGVITEARSVLIQKAAQDTILISYPCAGGPLVLCAAPPYRGTRTATGLVLHYSVAYRTPLVFARIGPVEY